MYQVLIADDEPWALYRLQKLIDWNRLDFEIVGTASDGLSALELIKQKKPELVLSDIRMPGLDGLKLVEQINLASPKTTVILITGFSEFSYAKEAIRQGVFDYLVKPVKREELTETLSRVIKRIQEKAATCASEEAACAVPTQIGKIMAAIDASYMQDIRLNDLADQFYLTAQYLSVLIKKETGYTYSELIIQKRISLAKDLLVKTDKPIQDIMEETGYHDYSHFIRLFKKQTGCTPYAYRKTAISPFLSTKPTTTA